MRNQSALEELNTKISLFMDTYHRLKDENMKLSVELGMVKEKLEAQKQEIDRLKEDEELRGMEIEDITQKIVKVLS
ncbi:hypothetical protein KKC13_10240 [bacterium]|nr:hypothetical protein [bacterium]MBU1958383.1 hypothetical protein [bacterium]